MADQVKLFTQSDLANLNSQLNVILNNLNTHVNLSLSKAHAVKVIPSAYYDSGGDQVNLRFTNGVMDVVMEFQFGTPPSNTAIYVPARIVAANTSPVKDPGPRTLGNGITFNAASPTGTSTSPGVPLAQKALVTTSPAEVAFEQATVYNDLLLLHQEDSINDVRELQAHGGIDFSTNDVLDTLGHIAGRFTVNIGWGGILYKMPGDTGINGPPQGPRLATALPGYPYRLNSGSSDRPFPMPNAAQIPPKLTIGFGAKPYFFQWQILNQTISNIAKDPPSTWVWNNLGPVITAAGPTTASGSVFSTRYPSVPLTWNIGLVTDPNTLQVVGSRMFNLTVSAPPSLPDCFIVRCVISNVSGSTFSPNWHFDVGGYA